MTGRRSESLDNPRQYGGNLEAYRERQGIDFLFMRNARWGEVKAVPFVRGVHLIRDPRDILVSAYFSHRNSHPEAGWPELVTHREALRALDMEEGLLREMDFSASVFEDIASWNYEDERVLELRFERLIADPYQTMLRAFSFLEVLREEDADSCALMAVGAGEAFFRRMHRATARVPLPRYRLDGVPAEWFLRELYRNRFEKLAGGRRPGREDAHSHFRKGVAGDWRQYFSPRVRDVFEERYGRVIRALQYDSA